MISTSAGIDAGAGAPSNAGISTMVSRFTTTAIVLRRREYGDYDLIVTVLTRDHGKRTLIAKSAKKSTKRFSGVLEPFNDLQIAFRESPRKGMAVLEEASLVQALGHVRSDFVKTAYASYWVESVALWMEEGLVRPDIYHLLGFVLRELDDRRMAPDLLNVLFQMRFIGQEGLRPVLDQCACCRLDIDQLSQHDFCVDLGQGGVVCNQCPSGVHGALRLSKGTLKQLAWIVDGDLARARRVRFSARAMAEATTFLEAFVPFHIGKAPKSLRILQQTRNK
jgi:DNA repair protein RecO (recombination protein O)